MKFGMRFGDPVGKVEPSAIYANITPEDPGARTITFTPERSAGVMYHLMVDGVLFWYGSATTIEGVPQGARDHIEIFETSDQNWDEDLTNVAASASDQIKLSWDEVSGADYYEVYRKVSGGSYGVPLAVIDAGQDSYELTDGPLDDATYVYKVTAYDEAGNAVASNEPEQAVSAAPDPPSGLSVSVSAGTLTLTYADSLSSDLSTHNIYRSGNDGIVDLGATAHATDVTSPWSEDVSALTGRYAYLLRAEDAAGNVEANLSQMVQVDLSSGVQVLRPNEPEMASAVAIADGQVRVHARYDREGEAGVATTINIYVNDGAGGAMDWGTSKGSGTLPTADGVVAVDVDSSGLTGGLTYLVGIRAKTAAAVEDTNTNTESVVTDSTAPSAPTLSLEVV